MILIFSRTQFYGKSILFRNVQIRGHCKFSDLTFGRKTIFRFENPKFFQEVNENYNQARVIFERVRFNPFATTFEGIECLEKLKGLVFIFRYCQLKDVFFSNSDMSNFSFYKSSFDEARFISSRWATLKDIVRRKNIIIEERVWREANKIEDKDEREKYLENYKLGGFRGWDDLASLYRRMKTALDRSKDNEQSGWFYFNEYEMKKRTLSSKIEKFERVFIHPTAMGLAGILLRKVKTKLPLYNLYKGLAGYGEKPLWSLWWFLIFIVIFGGMHLVTGIGNGSGSQINYNNINSITDIFTVVFFTISKAIPVSYIGGSITDYKAIGTLGQLISVLNAIVLLILAIFIAIGLKRHFRRF